MSLKISDVRCNIPNKNLIQEYPVDIISRLQQMNSWSLDYEVPVRNSIALKIGDSVITGSQHQSYVARAGPRWLQQAIAAEA